MVQNQVLAMDGWVFRAGTMKVSRAVKRMSAQQFFSWVGEQLRVQEELEAVTGVRFFETDQVRPVYAVEQKQAKEQSARQPAREGWPPLLEIYVIPTEKRGRQ